MSPISILWTNRSFIFTYFLLILLLQNIPYVNGQCNGCEGVNVTDCYDLVNNAVYACRGAFSNGLDDVTAQAICAVGYEICPSAARAGVLGLNTSSCGDIIANEWEFFASLQSSEGSAMCSDTGTNDIWGCALNAGNTRYNTLNGDNPNTLWGCDNVLVAHMSNDQGLPGQWSFGSGTDELNTVSLSATGNPPTVYDGGVLCCFIGTKDPTQEPTTNPSMEPTQEPTNNPSMEPTQTPTAEPTLEPTQNPTDDPTTEPSADPTNEPTLDPTSDPTQEPTVGCLGCSLGSEENGVDCYNLVDLNVYACRGAFTGGMNGVEAAAICEVGYEVCPSADRAGELGLNSTLCGTGIQNGEFYATKQSSERDAICSSTGTDDLWGCASDDAGNIVATYVDDSRAGCDNVLVAFLSTASDKAPNWSVDQGQSQNELNTVALSNEANGGVLCCLEGTSSPSMEPTAQPTTAEPTPLPTTAQPTRNPTMEPTTEPTQEPTTGMPTTTPTKAPTTAEPTTNPTTAEPTLQPTVDCSGCSTDDMCYDLVTNKVYACRGTFSGGLNGTLAQSICARGYEICPTARRAGILGLTTATCGGIIANEWEFFASQQSSLGNANCSISGKGTQDIWGCAKDDPTIVDPQIYTLNGPDNPSTSWQCDNVLVAFMSSDSLSHFGNRPAGWSFGDSNDELNTAANTQTADGGVLCCEVETDAPTMVPTGDPTSEPTMEPTAEPTNDPTTMQPTSNPTTAEPTKDPTTAAPTSDPTSDPTTEPTSNPTTAAPTSDPTSNPTTENPTYNPTTKEPTTNPTTAKPTRDPTTEPTSEPTMDPTMGCSGCSDGTDCYNLVDDGVYACRGAFSNGVTDPSAAAICATGYEVCPSAARAGEIGLTTATCGNIIENEWEFFASLQSSEGNAICSSTGTDDIWGCAKNIGNTRYLTLNGSNPNTMWGCDNVFIAFLSSTQSLPGQWSIADGTDELNTVSLSATGDPPTVYDGGVLCCRQATDPPTMDPTTKMPTYNPTTMEPTRDPTTGPTSEPTMNPTKDPTSEPTTAEPTTDEPTRNPLAEGETHAPSMSPTTSEPSDAPSENPTMEPTTATPTTSEPSESPTQRPSRSPLPGNQTYAPTMDPTTYPTMEPSDMPSGEPTTAGPTMEPTEEPTLEPITAAPSMTEIITTSTTETNEDCETYDYRFSITIVFTVPLLADPEEGNNRQLLRRGCSSAFILAISLDVTFDEENCIVLLDFIIEIVIASSRRRLLQDNLYEITSEFQYDDTLNEYFSNVNTTEFIDSFVGYVEDIYFDNGLIDENATITVNEFAITEDVRKDCFDQHQVSGALINAVSVVACINGMLFIAALIYLFREMYPRSKEQGALPWTKVRTRMGPVHYIVALIEFVTWIISFAFMIETIVFDLDLGYVGLFVSVLPGIIILYFRYALYNKLCIHQIDALQIRLENAKSEGEINEIAEEIKKRKMDVAVMGGLYAVVLCIPVFLIGMIFIEGETCDYPEGICIAALVFTFTCAFMELCLLIYAYYNKAKKEDNEYQNANAIELAEEKGQPVEEQTNTTTDKDTTKDSVAGEDKGEDKSDSEKLEDMYDKKKSKGTKGGEDDDDDKDPLIAGDGDGDGGDETKEVKEKGNEFVE